MKATLKFDLTDAEDRDAHLRAVHADAMWITLSRIAWWSKHDVPENGAEMLQRVKDTIYHELPNLNELGQ